MPEDLFTLRTGTADDFDELWRVLSLAFHDDVDEPERERARRVFEPDRSILGFAGDALAGTAVAYTRELTVPGGMLTAAHVSMVAVDPAHRRRGLLTRMMLNQLADVRARGEAVAVLWATEGRIYQRFGYGLASRRLFIEAEREAALRTPPPAGRLRTTVPADVVADLAKIFDRVRVGRVGWSSRDGAWWDRLLADPAAYRGGTSPMRAVLHEGPDGLDGYALWRARRVWGPTGPDGEVAVQEVVAATPDAYRALWHHVLTIDLTRRTSLFLASTAEPLLYLINEPRRLGSRLADGLWLRVIDVPAALSARRYAAPVDVVIEVTDPLLGANSGAWHLVGDRDGARCTPAQRPADLHCDVAALGAAYLGDASLAVLAAADLVRELVPGTLAPAAAAFGWPVPPSATEIF